MISLKKLLTKILVTLPLKADLERGTAIPANSDLNNYVASGTYYVSGATIASSLSHTPITSVGFKLFVMHTTVVMSETTGGIAQIAISNSTTGLMYFRYLGSGTWGSWVRFARSNEIDNIAMFKKVSYSYAYTNLTGNRNISGTNLDVSTPSGYTPVAITAITTGSTDIIVRGYNAEATGSSAVVALKNISSTGVSATVTVKILYMNSNYVG